MSWALQCDRCGDEAYVAKPLLATLQPLAGEICGRDLEEEMIESFGPELASVLVADHGFVCQGRYRAVKVSS